MKKIECILKEERLKTTLDSLLLAGVPGATVTRVEGFGTQGSLSDPLLKPKVKIEIYVEDEEMETLLQTLLIAGRGGKMGDGKIAVLELEDLYRIRTGERRRQALY